MCLPFESSLEGYQLKYSIIRIELSLVKISLTQSARRSRCTPRTSVSSPIASPMMEALAPPNG